MPEDLIDPVVQADPEYPALCLAIKNELPTIVLCNDADTEKVLLKGDQGIDTALMNLADSISFSDYTPADLMALLNTGDETVVEFPEYDLTHDQELNLQRIIDIAAQKAPQLKPQVDAAPAVVAQLERDLAIDILASAREEIYNFLIATILHLADELVIPNLQLRDHRHESRLVEKMAQVLTHGGIDLIVV